MDPLLFMLIATPFHSIHSLSPRPSGPGRQLHHHLGVSGHLDGPGFSPSVQKVDLSSKGHSSYPCETPAGV